MFTYHEKDAENVVCCSQNCHASDLIGHLKHEDILESETFNNLLAQRNIF